MNFAGPPAPGPSDVSSTLPNGATVNSGGTTATNDVFKVLPPSLATFVANLPAVEGIPLLPFYLLYLFIFIYCTPFLTESSKDLVPKYHFRAY